MNRCYTCLALLILSPVLLFFTYYGFARDEFAYRMTLAVDTPAGLRQSSNVVRVAFSPSFGWPSRGVGKTGEATFVDLGNGKHVVALMASGPLGDNGNFHMLLAGAFFGERRDGVSNRPALDIRELPIGTRAELRGTLVPTLVSFADINDPMSGEVVQPDGFGATFGQGYALRSASFELVAPGIWPLNLIPIPWPHILFGAPVTTGIEQKLPFLMTHWKQLYELRSGRIFLPRFGSFIRRGI